MYIEFMDGRTVRCDRILGGPRVINGIERDVLSIEIIPQYKLREPKLEELKPLFQKVS